MPDKISNQKLKYYLLWNKHFGKNPSLEDFIDRDERLNIIAGNKVSSTVYENINKYYRIINTLVVSHALLIDSYELQLNAVKEDSKDIVINNDITYEAIKFFRIFLNSLQSHCKLEENYKKYGILVKSYEVSEVKKMPLSKITDIFTNFDSFGFIPPLNLSNKITFITLIDDIQLESVVLVNSADFKLSLKKYIITLTLLCKQTANSQKLNNWNFDKSIENDSINKLLYSINNYASITLNDIHIANEVEEICFSGSVACNEE